MELFQTDEEIKHLQVSSGFYPFSALAQHVLGVSAAKLKGTDAFFDYFEKNGIGTGNPIPWCDFVDIMTECFSADHPVFLGTMAMSAGYGTPQSFQRAVNSSGIAWPIQKDFGVWWMEQSSYAAGPMNIRRITEQQQLNSRANLTRDLRLVPNHCNAWSISPTEIRST